MMVSSFLFCKFCTYDDASFNNDEITHHLCAVLELHQTNPNIIEIMLGCHDVMTEQGRSAIQLLMNDALHSVMTQPSGRRSTRHNAG